MGIKYWSDHSTRFRKTEREASQAQSQSLFSAVGEGINTASWYFMYAIYIKWLCVVCALFPNFRSGAMRSSSAVELHAPTRRTARPQSKRDRILTFGLGSHCLIL